MTTVAEGLMDLSTPLSGIISDVPADKREITVRQLLTHSAGMPAHRPFYRKWLRDSGRGCKPGHREILRTVLKESLEYRPGTMARYSDLGYMVLGCLVEKITGMPFREYVRAAVLEPLGAGKNIVDSIQAQATAGYEGIAPTGFCPFEHRPVHGEVNDLNARAMGGFAGHAGLFGTAEGVTGLLERLMGIYHGRETVSNIPRDVIRMFWTRDNSVHGSTWALGFDTPSPEISSAGRFFSKKSAGHLGFTGTSFWIDTERAIIIVFLSNRTFPGATPKGQEAMKRFRPGLHDAVMEMILEQA